MGFVFGSYGVNRTGEPIVILNGVYLDRKTDLAVSKILEKVEAEFAKPLGAAEILIASLHAGRSNLGSDYENTDEEVKDFQVHPDLAVEDNRSLHG